MAKLYFYYSAMNAGKSTSLLQSAYNYKERGMIPFILSAAIDNRYSVGKVTSRIGLEAEAHLFHKDDDLFKILSDQNLKNPIDCVLIDESQFLTRDQVKQLAQSVDNLNIQCYVMELELILGASFFLEVSIFLHGQII